MNRASALQFSAGHLSPTRAVTLEVVGRRSGRTISFPVVVADYQGERYLVSMLGQEANWVRNVRAAGGRAVLRRGGHEAVHLTEVDVGSRAPILRRYLEVAPGARPHVPVDRHAPLEDFEHIAAQFPVFRITTVAAHPVDVLGEAGTRPQATLELSAHMTVRPGQLDGFRRQAAECIRVTREKDTRTLRYDWFLSSDGTECEVREAYVDAQGLIEHRAHVEAALSTLFVKFADNHFMTVYGDAAPELLDLAETHHMTGHMKWFSFFDGLGSDMSP
ncbi:MAG TPA: hypothetical protein VK204_00095 [Nocardioidaceae bacterium]|nr:hypothetical protein [Nocardioidaceae bacterium]